ISEGGKRRAQLAQGAFRILFCRPFRQLERRRIAHKKSGRGIEPRRATDFTVSAQNGPSSGADDVESKRSLVNVASVSSATRSGNETSTRPCSVRLIGWQISCAKLIK